MRALALLCINQHTKLPSFTDSKHMIAGQNLQQKTCHVTLTTPIRGSLSFHLMYCTCIQSLVTLALAIPDI